MNFGIKVLMPLLTMAVLLTGCGDTGTTSVQAETGTAAQQPAQQSTQPATQQPAQQPTQPPAQQPTQPPVQQSTQQPVQQSTQQPAAPADESGTAVNVTAEEKQIVPGLSAVGYEGEYGLDAFLMQGGAVSDGEVVEFLENNLGGAVPSIQTRGFGCSALSVPSPEGHALFGRNFDWNACEALIVQSVPAEGYASISTVNMGFLGSYLDRFPTQARTLAALYAPLDGMNEKGLCVAVLMIQDSTSINQDTGKPDLTTTTAVRVLLDHAANVEEALDLLEQYDLHASMGMMIHFALADAAGRSAAVEYIGNEMVVTETPVLTNFYLAEGEKQGIGTAQSHTRYNILMDTLRETPSMTLEQVRDAMDSVSKDNFGEFESTEWTAVYDQFTGEVRYYHRENYQDAYVFQVG